MTPIYERVYIGYLKKINDINESTEYIGQIPFLEN